VWSWAMLLCFGGTCVILLPGLSVSEDGVIMFLRNTGKTDQFHRNNTKSACRRVGSISKYRAATVFIWCWSFLWNTGCTICSNTKQNPQTESTQTCYCCERTGIMLLVGLLGCGLADIHRITICFWR
jgi:hypothetical protein